MTGPVTRARTGSVEAGGPIHFLEWRRADRSGPCVVCVHGVGADSSVWRSVGEELSVAGPVVAVDLPGYGGSPRAGRPSTLLCARRALGAFIEARALGPVVLVGSSFGGAVCVALAAHDPAAVRGLVLTSSYHPPVLGAWRAPIVLGSMAADQLAAAGRIARRRALASRRRSLRRSSPTDASAGHGRRADAAPAPGHDRRATREGIWSLAALSVRPGAARALFERARCPALILHGSEDPLVPVSWAEASAARHADWELRTFPGVAHLARVANTGLWTRDVVEWISALAHPSTSTR